MAMIDDQHSTADRFLGLLRPIERDLENYCRGLLFYRADLPDAIQSAVLRAWHAFDRYHDDASFRAWMFRILSNEAFTLNRRRRRITQFEVPVEPGEMDGLIGDDAFATNSALPLSWEELADALDEQIVASLDTLNQTERAVLLLRAIGQLRYQEISESLDIPLGSVMGNLSRARQKMRDAIARSRRRTAP